MTRSRSLSQRGAVIIFTASLMTRSRQLTQRSAAIIFHGVAHGGLQVIQFLRVAPTNGVMLGWRKSGLPRFGAREINHANVFVRFTYAMNVQEARANERARAGARCGRTLANQLNIKAALLFGFAQRGLLWVLIKFNVAAQRKPSIQFLVMNDQNFSSVHHKDGDGEIYFLVNVCHEFNLKWTTGGHRGTPDYG